MEPVVDEVFEVQAMQPFHGWVFERLCDRTGNTHRALTAAAALVQPKREWDRLNLIDFAAAVNPPLEVGVLPSDDWMWSHDWIPDAEFSQCDEEGWSYGSTMARIIHRLAEGTSKVSREYYHFLRRRRWIRMRIKKPDVVEQELQRPALVSMDENDDFFKDSLDATKRFYRMYRDPIFSQLYCSSDATQQPSHFIRVEFSDDDIQREGWLGQRGSFSRSWKLRYFLLRSDSSSLVCLRDRASMVQVSETFIDRHTSVLIDESPNPHQFQFLVISNSHKLRLNAVDSSSRSLWLSAISELIVRSRASFFAGDDSDGNLTRTLRRIHSSFAMTDDGIVRPSSSSNLLAGVDVKKLRRRAWRPYKLVSSTMALKEDHDQGISLEDESLRVFEQEIQAMIELIRTHVMQNIDILEENLEAAEEFLSSAVVSVPTEQLAELRRDTHESLEGFRSRLKAFLSAPERGLWLRRNAVKKELYMEAKQLHERVLSFMPPVAQATIKKKAGPTSSAPTRRIPDDWFTGPVPLTQSPPSSDEDQSEFKVVNVDSPALSSFHDKQRSRRSSSTGDTTRITGSRASAATTVLDPIKVKSYHNLPSALVDGWFELPNGVNDYAVKMHEKDLGSLIAYSLSSKTYCEDLAALFGNSIDVAKDLQHEESQCSRKWMASLNEPEATIPDSVCPLQRRQQYLDKLRSYDLQKTEMKLFVESNGSSQEMRCISYCAAQFHALRALIAPGNLGFLDSISESKRWETTGGKSGAFFSMTHDKRYILKGIPVTECNMFMHMALEYFQFMANVVENQSETVITKIVGLYKITHYRRLQKHSTYVVVMENLSFGFSPGQMYDIKGLLRRRYHYSSSDEERDSLLDISKVQAAVDLPVLLDGNLAERIPVPVCQSDLAVIEKAIENDTKFLCQAGVIDYSLLMLFDEERREIVFGLIDYIHQFDFLKKMESTSKASLTFRDPTVISPISYRRRFMNAINRYLVGIELELEMRMRKRNRGSKNYKKQLSNGTMNDRKAKDRPLRVTNGFDTKVMDEIWPHKRSQSLPHISTDVSYDHNAALPHSDGEEFSSSSSDENCLKESQALLTAMLPSEGNSSSTSSS